MVRLTLAIQRLNWRLPEPLAALARKVFAGRAAVQADAAAEDWRQPLLRDAVAPQTVSEPGSAAVTDLVRTPVAAPSRPERRHRLRCLLVTGSLDVGGMDEVVSFLARRLPEYGVDTSVLHPVPGSSAGHGNGRLAVALRGAGIEVVELPQTSATEFVRSWAPDVISAHGAPRWVVDTAADLGIPFVDTLHGMHDLLSADPADESERGSKISRLVVVSELVSRQYLALNPAFDPQHVIVIPNGVDDTVRKLADRSRARSELGLRGEFLFLSLGRYCLQKNTYGLVAAFGDVARSHPEAHLLVAGRVDDPLYFAQVQRLRVSSPAVGRIHLRDHHPDPSRLLAAADAFVLDSFFEGWSLASMEALFAGLPVVLGDVAGAREQVGDDGLRGYLVANPAGDPLLVDWGRMRAVRYSSQRNRAELVEAMRAMVADRAAWARRRSRIQTESARRFHPDLCLSRHAEILAAAAEAGRMSSACA